MIVYLSGEKCPVSSAGCFYSEKRKKELSRETLNKFLRGSEDRIEWETVKLGYKSLGDFV